jgi:hypothetical protein
MEEDDDDDDDDSRSVRVRFALDRVALGHFFSQYFSIPCQYFSTDAPYSSSHAALSGRTNGEVLRTFRGIFVTNVLSYCVLVSNALAPF